MKKVTKHRHYVLKELVMPRMGRPEVMLVGAGGIGSQMISGLARMHHALVALGHTGLDVVVCDRDEVSDANVGRQLFSPVDAGRNKATVLVNRVNNFFGLGWKSFPFDVSRLAKNSSRCDIIITAVDNVETRKSVASMGVGDYHLDLGNKRSSGQVILGTIKNVAQPNGVMNIARLPKATELYPDMGKDDADQGPSCSVRQALERQDLFINQWVATAALDLLWQMFRQGYIENHGSFINAKAMTVRPLAIDPEGWLRMGWKTAKKMIIPAQ